MSIQNQSQNQPRKRPRREPAKVRPVGRGVALRSKFDSQGRLVVQLVGVRKKRSIVSAPEGKREKIEDIPEPGMWLDLSRLDLEKLTMVLGDLERISRSGSSPHEPMKQQPFAGFEAQFAAFDLAGITVAEVPPEEEAPPAPARGRRPRPVPPTPGLEEVRERGKALTALFREHDEREAQHRLELACLCANRITRNIARAREKIRALTL